MREKLSSDWIQKIQLLINSEKGDVWRLKDLLERIKHGKKVYNSDMRYVSKLLEQERAPDRSFGFAQPLLETESVFRPELETSFVYPKSPTLTMYRGAERYKSEGTTLVLSLFLGFFGAMGIGQLYQGSVKKSLAILYSGVVLLFFNALLITSFVSASDKNFEFADLFYQVFSIIGYESKISSFLTALMMFLVPAGYLCLLIWQIFDAREMCVKFNRHMDRNGEDLVQLTKEKKITFVVLGIAPLVGLVMYFLSLYLGSLPV